MIDGLPKTGKSTLCYNISSTPPHTHTNYLFALKTSWILFVLCIYMMNDTPSTGKSTLCCNISITHQTNKLFICMENNFEIVVYVLLRMTLLVLENQPYATFFYYTTNKNICFAWKTVYTRAGRALVRDVDGSPGGWPLTPLA